MPDGGAVAVHVDDAVDKEKRIAMRQKLQDVGDLRLPELRLHSALIHENSAPWTSGTIGYSPSRFTFALIKLQILAFGKLAQQRELPEPEPHRLGRGASPPHARRHIASHIAARRDLRASADLDVADDADLAAKGHEIAEFGAARNTGLGHDDAMPSNHHVVPDLHEIINFRAFPDHRVAQGAPVDRRIGADFDVVLDDHAADLRALSGGRPCPWRSRTRPGRWRPRRGW